MLHPFVEYNNLTYVSLERETGKFEVDGNLFEGIEGYLLGFGSHEFEFKGKKQKKFDIYLVDNDETYQIQLGFYSWLTLKVMNMLLSLQDFTNPKLLFIARKDKNENDNIFIKHKNSFLKWKYPFEELKLKDLEDNLKLKTRNEIIGKWYEHLLTLKPFVLNELTEESAEIEEIDDNPF
ncbi:MAG: hypothetical protein N2560_01590 [Ignavibacteria bacterium]|nr:hypothetical protein [Ignavibacteria bacterium]